LFFASVFDKKMLKYRFLYDIISNIRVVLNMTREQYLREKIESLGNIKDFALKIDMPYSTLLSILKNVGGASIDNILKICKGLNITADTLESISTTKDTKEPTVEIEDILSTATYMTYGGKELSDKEKKQIRNILKTILEE
jgi:transcriptional regulator with XRE-family HTH domain